MRRILIVAIALSVVLSGTAQGIDKVAGLFSRGIIPTTITTPGPIANVGAMDTSTQSWIGKLMVGWDVGDFTAWATGGLEMFQAGGTFYSGGAALTAELTQAVDFLSEVPVPITIGAQVLVAHNDAPGGGTGMVYGGIAMTQVPLTEKLSVLAAYTNSASDVPGRGAYQEALVGLMYRFRD